MNTKIVGNILGRVLLIVAGLMLLPTICAAVYRESVLPFVWTILLLGCAGFALTRLRPESQDIYAREGFVCVGASWVLMSLFGALPFLFSGEIPHPVDAVFETVSGFTTTGATILAEVEHLSHGIQFWRLFTHWIGGMGVLVFIMAVLPASGEHYMHIMRAEVPGPTVGKLVPRIRKTARILYMIYIGLTALETIFLLCGGLSFYEALLHAFATAGTGGFSTRNASIAGFDSVYVEMVIATFMVLFGLNFNLYYLLLLGQLRTVVKSEELRLFLLIVAGAALLIAANIASQVGGFLQGLRYSYFQVATIVSTTGFATADFNAWPEFSKWLLFLLMFVGGCAGSTAGGMKLSRVMILAKSYAFELKKLILPSRVRRIWSPSCRRRRRARTRISGRRRSSAPGWRPSAAKRRSPPSRRRSLWAPGRRWRCCWWLPAPGTPWASWQTASPTPPSPWPARPTCETAVPCCFPYPPTTACPAPPGASPPFCSGRTCSSSPSGRTPPIRSPSPSSRSWVCWRTPWPPPGRAASSSRSCCSR